MGSDVADRYEAGMRERRVFLRELSNNRWAFERSDSKAIACKELVAAAFDDHHEDRASRSCPDAVCLDDDVDGVLSSDFGGVFANFGVQSEKD